MQLQANCTSMVCLVVNIRYLSVLGIPLYDIILKTNLILIAIYWTSMKINWKNRIQNIYASFKMVNHNYFSWSYRKTKINKQNIDNMGLKIRK